VFTEHGLPCSLYTDRGSHSFTTLKAGGRVNRGEPTQVGRALRQLGVEHIAAYSPEARGRSERAFRTLQDRLPKELALAGITTMAAANAYLRETYVAAHNARFAVTAEQPGSAFVPVSGVDLREVLCYEEERQVGCDNEFRPSSADEFWPTSRCLTGWPGPAGQRRFSVLPIMLCLLFAVPSCGGTDRSPCLS
jgi:hypothetical protein